jgi:hypothetical protein
MHVLWKACAGMPRLQLSLRAWFPLPGARASAYAGQSWPICSEILPTRLTEAPVRLAPQHSDRHKRAARTATFLSDNFNRSTLPRRGRYRSQPAVCPGTMSIVPEDIRDRALRCAGLMASGLGDTYSLIPFVILNLERGRKVLCKPFVSPRRGSEPAFVTVLASKPCNAISQTPEYVYVCLFDLSGSGNLSQERWSGSIPFVSGEVRLRLAHNAQPTHVLIACNVSGCIEDHQIGMLPRRPGHAIDRVFGNGQQRVCTSMPHACKKFRPSMGAYCSAWIICV